MENCGSASVSFDINIRFGQHILDERPFLSCHGTYETSPSEATAAEALAQMPCVCTYIRTQRLSSKAKFNFIDSKASSGTIFREEELLRQQSSRWAGILSQLHVEQFILLRLLNEVTSYLPTGSSPPLVRRMPTYILLAATTNLTNRGWTFL